MNRLAMNRVVITMLASSSLLVACSTQQDRYPAAASSPIPYVPSRPGSNTGSNNGGGHTTTPTPSTPSPSETTVDSTKTCSEKNMDAYRRRQDTSSLTVGRILNGLQAQPGALVTKGTFYIRWDQDPEVLRKVFKDSTRPGGKLYQMSEYSPAIRRAINFVNGFGGDTDGTYDPLVDGRLAWIMAALVGSKDNSECVRFVLKNIDKLVGAELAADLRSLPFEKAAKHEGPNYSTLEQHRVERQKQIARLEAKMKSEESKHRVELTKLTVTLRQKTAELQRELIKIPNCKTKIAKFKIKRHETASDDDSYASRRRRRTTGRSRDRDSDDATPATYDVPDPSEMVAACKDQITDELDKNSDKKSKKVDRLSELCVKYECDPTDEGSDADKPQVKTLRKEIKKLDDEAEKLAGYQRILDGEDSDGDKSIETMLADVKTALDEYDDGANKTAYNSKNRDQRDNLLKEEETESKDWWAKGTFAGFNATAIRTPSSSRSFSNGDDD